MQNAVAGSLILLSLLSSPVLWADTLTHTTLTLPSNIGFVATSAGGDAIFATDATASSEVDIYSPSTKSWSVSHLSLARMAMGATYSGNEAFFAGGYSSGYSGLVDIYNTSNNQWSTASLSQPRAYVAGVSVGGTVLFAGGQTTGDQPSNVVDIYNVAAKSWSTAQLSVARDQLAGTAVGNLAVFAGGIDKLQGASTVADIYNSATHTWTTSTMPVGILAEAATTVGNLAIFAGGVTDPNNPDAGTNVAEIYNSITGSWTTAHLSQAREFLAATTVGNDALFAGGATISSNGATNYYNVVDIFDSSTNSWATTTLSQARLGTAGTTVETQAFFGGGGDASGNSNVVDVYTDQVPEPGSALIVAFAATGFIVRRTRRAQRGSVCST